MNHIKITAHNEDCCLNVDDTSPFLLKCVNQFLYSKLYIFLIAVLSLQANVFASERLVYTIYCLTGICVCLFSIDVLPLIPIVICAYFSPSMQNNPGVHKESIFYLDQFGIQILMLIGFVLTALVIRLCFDKRIGWKTFLGTPRKLLTGLILLGLAYFLSGIRLENYSEIAHKNLVFAAIQFLSLFFFYFLFTGCVIWEHAPEDYIVFTGISVGLLLISELVNIYMTQDVIQNGMIIRKNIYTGWGMYNNIGGMLVMAVPFPYFYLCKRKKILLNSLLEALICAGILLSCSRGAILVSVLIVLLSICYCLVYTKSLRLLLLFIIILLPIGYAAYIYTEQISTLFFDILTRGLNPMTRDIMYVNGISQFLKEPVFGGSFYPSDYNPWDFSTLQEFSNVFPPRWHNTYIQLLASCGLVGLLAYFVHRLQVIIMFAGQRTCLKQIAEFSTLSLIAASLIDCHFFNIGPALFYSILLACAEKTPHRPKEPAVDPDIRYPYSE